MIELSYPQESRLTLDTSNRNAVKILGNYDVRHTIGKGQFGKVKVARHVLTQNEVAIKIINKTLLNEMSLKMIRREISIMKLLCHPHIIQLYEIIETDKFFYLVMEYASKGEMLEHIETNGPLPEHQAVKYFYQILLALQYCHAHRIVHRDLKTENLLLDSKNDIKIIDFSLSNHFVPGEKLRTFCGSPTYAAPELILKQEYRGPEVDIWSLGVVLYYFVCGKLPFLGHDFNSLFHAILRCDYVVPDHISADCLSLLKRMLVVDPNERATLDEIFKHVWVDEYVSRELSDEERQHSFEDTFIDPLSYSLPSEAPDDCLIDESVVSLMESLGYTRSDIISSIMGNAYNSTASTYLLLRQKLDKLNPSRETHQRRHSFSNQRPKKKFEVPALDVLDYRRHRRNRTMDSPVLQYLNESSDPKSCEGAGNNNPNANESDETTEMKSVFANGKKSVSFVFQPEDIICDEEVNPYPPAASGGTPESCGDEGFVQGSGGDSTSGSRLGLRWILSSTNLQNLFLWVQGLVWPSLRKSGP